MLKIKKKPKVVKKNNPDCTYVDKWGRQYSCPDIRIIWYSSGIWVDVTFSQSQRPTKLWRIEEPSGGTKL